MTVTLKARGLTTDTANAQTLMEQFKGDWPLLPGEDEQALDDLRQACINTVKPADAVEEIWLTDFINRQWEVMRWQRVKVALFKSSRQEAVERLLRGHDADQLLIAADTAEGWATGDKTAISCVEKFLGLRHLDEDAIHAKAFQLNSKTFEQLDRLIASSEHRRDKALHLLEQRRELLARRAKEFPENIQDADYEDIPKKST